MIIHSSFYQIKVTEIKVLIQFMWFSINTSTQWLMLAGISLFWSKLYIFMSVFKLHHMNVNIFIHVLCAIACAYTSVCANLVFIPTVCDDVQDIRTVGLYWANWIPYYGMNKPNILWTLNSLHNIVICYCVVPDNYISLSV